MHPPVKPTRQTRPLESACGVGGFNQPTGSIRREPAERAAGGAATSVTARSRTKTHAMIVSSGGLEVRWKAGAHQ